MTRTDMSAATNVRLAPVAEYGIDPRGWSFFRALSGAAQRGISGHDGTRVLDTARQFHGYTTTPQRFVGLAPLGVAVPLVKDGSVLADETTAFDNAAQRIFAERLRSAR